MAVNKDILFFTGAMSEGGAERVISVLSNQLVENGYNVTLILYYSRNIFYNLNCKIRVIELEKETGTKRKLVNFAWLRRYFKNNSATIISFLSLYNMFAILANFGLGNRIIVANRSDPNFELNSKVLNNLRNFLYHFADKLVCQTEEHLNYFSCRIQKKGCVIYNPNNIPKEKYGSALKQKKKNEIVSVGRLIPLKNHIFLLKVFNEIHFEYPSYTLTIYGEGPERNNLEKYIIGNHLEDCVTLPGSIQNVTDKIKESQIFVLTSLYEGMPNSLLEAMSLGLPVISTMLPGAKEFITNGYNGILVKQDNEYELKEAIKHLIKSPNIREYLAKNAVEVCDLIDPKIITEQWMSIIDSY